MTPVLRELHWLYQSTEDHIQDSSSGIQVSTWCGSAIPAVVLWVDVNVHWPSSPAFFTDETAGRSYIERGWNTATVASPSKDLRALDISQTVFRNKLKTVEYCRTWGSPRSLVSDGRQTLIAYGKYSSEMTCSRERYRLTVLTVQLFIPIFDRTWIFCVAN